MIMQMTQTFLRQLTREAVTTQKMLSRVPDDKYDWKPHAKSMNIRSLATHIAELPTWIPMVLHTTELDFASSPYQPLAINATAALMTHFEESLAEGKKALEAAKDEDLIPDWTLRNGAQVLSLSSKEDVIRMTISQIIHHRAQLGVYMRLLDIPIPGSYGPSADDDNVK
jgi:uncharacterized damage-inducible protein DinB